MSTSVVPLPVVARPGWLARDLGYLLLGLPLGIAAFVVSVAGFAAGVGTLVIWFGIPLLVGTLAAARGFAKVERRRVEAVNGRPLPPHHYRTAAGSGLGRLVRSVLDPQSWRHLLHAVVAFPLRVASFAIAVAWAVAGLGETLYVLWEWALPRGGDNQTLLDLMFDVPSRLADIGFHTAIGLILLLTLRPVLRGLTLLQTGLARGLLTNETAALRTRTTQLAEGRRAAAAAEAQTLRRVERDIHDGPQQRLVRLTMDLEAAQRRFDDDPDRARPLVAEALEQSREALAELRAVSRGIAPPVLVDRGLGVAGRRPRRPVARRRGADRVLRRGGGADQRREALRRGTGRGDRRLRRRAVARPRHRRRLGRRARGQGARPRGARRPGRGRGGLVRRRVKAVLAWLQP